ncbi:MAG: outer membrane beta-barrel protein [Bacteroidales bacterium]|nr:outer membrane beta-barrel protein [Candidatus Colimorpha onthohippi]
MKNLLTRIVLIITILIAFPLQASIPIVGKVAHKQTSEPISFATIALLGEDSTIINGTTTDIKGQFTINAPKNGKYLIAVSYVGYTKNIIPIVANATTINVGTITIEPDATTLNTVQVTAKTPLIEQKADKLVMNISQSAFAQGNSAFDLLRKAPGVTIDKDGNVLLNGQAVSVWIDGRPTYLNGKNLEALLHATDGNNINKIEIIANPSAKYDAAGQGGIIDIKTKHSLAKGLNGQLSANAGGMTYSRQLDQIDEITSNYFSHDINLNLNYRTNKTNSFLQISENSQPMGFDVETHESGKIGNTTYEQRSYSLFNSKMKTYNVKLGNDWFIDSKNTFGFIFTMPITHFSQVADTNVNRFYQCINNNVSQQVTSYTLTEFKMQQMMGNINYTHIFDPQKQSEITANIDYLHNAYVSDNDVSNYYITPQFPIMWHNIYDSAYSIQLNSDYTIDIYSAKVDWQSVVMGKFMMEAGAKWAMTQTDNQLTNTFTNLMSTASPTDGTSLFDYTEHIGALYTTLAGQLSKLWTAKVGLRGEYTYASNSLGLVKQSYFDLFPSVYVGYTSKDQSKRISFSYTRRIERPNFRQLNPFRNYIDAHISNIGNPDLKPSYSDRFYITLGLGRYVSIYTNYTYSKDLIGGVPNIDIVSGEQQFGTDNFGFSHIYGAGFTLSELPLGKPFTLMVNAVCYGINNQTTIASSYLSPNGLGSDETYSSTSLYGNIYTTLTWNMPKQWKLQAEAYVVTPYEQGYMKMDWNYTCNLGIKKTTLNNQLVLSANINDIFRTLNASFEIKGINGISSHYTQKYLIQKVSVGIQWNFGTAQKPLKQRKVGNLDEASRVGKQ